MVSEDSDSDRAAQRLIDMNDTRRRFLAGSAGAIGGLTLGGAFATPALAGGDDEDTDEDAVEGEPPGTTEDEFEDDVDILNYARTLEFLEYRFYERGLDNISEEDLTDSHPIHHFGDPVTDHVYDHIGRIRDHEETHVETLGAVVEDLGGDPVDEPEFDFGTAVEEPEEFIATAVALEDTGVSAYAGAAPHIENEDLVPPALSIHSVEARHASFLRVLDEQVPFPEPFDDPRSKSEVLEIASQFIAE